MPSIIGDRAFSFWGRRSGARRLVSGGGNFGTGLLLGQARGGEFGQSVEQDGVLARLTGENAAHDVMAEFHAEAEKVLRGLIGRELLMCRNHLFEPLFLEPILVLMEPPAREIIFIERFAGLPEPLDDLSVGQAIVDHDVDLLADSFGQMEDFAGAAAFEGASKDGERVDHFGFSVVDFGFRIPGLGLGRIYAVEKPRMDTNEHEFTNSNYDSAVCAAVTK
jgi:hypothetical protein